MSAFLDIVMLAVAAVFVVMGVRRGAIGEVFRLAAMTGGIFTAFIFHRDLQAVMGGVSSSPQAVAVIAFVIIYAATFFAVVGIGFLLRKFTKLVMLGWLDGTLGGAIGFLKAALIAWAACVSISAMPSASGPDGFGRSVVYRAYGSLPHRFTLSGLESLHRAVRGGKKPDAGDNAGGEAPDGGGKNGEQGKTPNRQQKSGKAAGTDV